MNDMSKVMLEDVVEVVVEKPKAEKPKTKRQRWMEWKEQNRAAYMEANKAQVCCTPSRAQAMLIAMYNDVNEWEG